VANLSPPSAPRSLLHQRAAVSAGDRMARGSESVRLDLSQLDPRVVALQGDSAHADPIPWKGKVGAVVALDAPLEVRAPVVVGSAATPLDALAAKPHVAAKRLLKIANEHVAQANAGPEMASANAASGGLRLGVGVGATSIQAAADGAALAPAVPKRPAKIDPKRAGSGIPARRVVRLLVWARRASQIGFFALFMFFLFKTGFRGSFVASADTAVRLPYPVEAFLLADPFVATMTVLSTHTVYRGLLWSLGLLGVTLVFGRVFCGWICPFGTLHHFFGWLLPSRRGRGAARVLANKTHTYQRAKYYLMYAFIAASLAGSAVGGLFDPICVAVRAIGLGVIPALQYAGGRGLASAQDVPSRPVQHAADSAQDFLANTVWQSHQFYFHQTWFILFLLVAVLFANRFVPRFWCRVLCPLGAFLGVFSRFALFGMEKDHAKCTDCNLCLVNCQGADSPQGGVKWRQDECHMCMNCETACPEDVIKFRFLPNRKSAIKTPDTDRRTLLASTAAGALFIPGARIADALDVNYQSKIIRPPGAVEERAFLERCIRCAECMKVCPNNALHPAFLEAGIEGIWTPILIARIGYCEHSCVLCGQVCPTGAIQKISEKEKLGIGVPAIKIGTAFYDHGRCLPWSMQTPCIVCEEFCPTSPKAIWVEEVEAPVRDDKPGPDGAPPEMKAVKLQRPHVDPSLCIGCGACEKVCPVQDQPAVYITSVGESRSKTNVILLENTNYNQKS
jgi:polyferredoxin